VPELSEFIVEAAGGLIMRSFFTPPRKGLEMIDGAPDGVGVRNPRFTTCPLRVLDLEEKRKLAVRV
jgi:hypothetical protein